MKRRPPLWRSDKKVRNGNFARLGLVMVVVCCMVAMMFCVAPPSRVISAGDIVTHDIAAPFDVEDVEATGKAREQARAQAEPLYYNDDAEYKSLQQQANGFFAEMDRLHADAEAIRKQKIQMSSRDSDLRRYETGNLSVDEWQKILEGDGIADLSENFRNILSEGQIYNMLALSESQYSLWLREASVRLNSYLRRGIIESQAEEVQRSYLEEMEMLTPLAIRSVDHAIAREFLRPTMFFDATATEKAIDRAENEVRPIIIEKGELLAHSGDTISGYQYSLLRQAGYALSWSEVFQRWAFVFAFYSVALALTLAYGRIFYPILLKSPVNSFLMAILVAVNILLAFLMPVIHQNINISYFSAMMVTQLISSRAAILGTLLLMPVTGFIAGGSVVFDYYLVAQSMMATLVGSLAGIFVVRKAVRRSSMIYGGIASGIAMTAVYALFNVLRGQSVPATEILFAAMWAIGSGIASAVLGIGLLPFWEVIFDVATPARLMELSNANHPLLQRLMLEAPGTYNHSMMIASMAESCASAIEANASLARVGAYFHDIGKLKRPMYFAENQRGINPHDELDAYTSSAIITAHVYDGIELAKQNKLPMAVRDVIEQHHGDTITASFYAKAVREEMDPNLTKDKFRYAGPRPQTKEAAIIMLMDSIEAAVRSLEIQNRDTIRVRVDKIISDKITDSQFSDCALTFIELEKIKQTVMRIYDGILHERIAYPDIEVLKEELGAHLQS